MKCYVHVEADAVGTCVNCGKFICQECATEISGKNYCKKCVGDIFSQKDKEIEQTKAQNNNSTPMVFMNAGGGGASSSSSSSSAASGRPAVPYPRNSVLIHFILAFFTCGVGNLIYWLIIHSQQSNWRRMYGG